MERIKWDGTTKPEDVLDIRNSLIAISVDSAWCSPSHGAIIAMAVWHVGYV